MKYCKKKKKSNKQKKTVISLTQVWKFVSMGMVHTARPYVIFIIVNKSNLVKVLLPVSLLHVSDNDPHHSAGKDGELVLFVYSIEKKELIKCN